MSDAIAGFVAGLFVMGIGVLWCGVFVRAAQRVKDRKRRADSVSFLKYLVDASTTVREAQAVSRLLGILKNAGHIHMQIASDRKRLTPTEEGVLLTMRGIDTLVRRTNLEPQVIDLLLQRGVDFSLTLANQLEPEPGNGRPSSPQ